MNQTHSIFTIEYMDGKIETIVASKCRPHEALADFLVFNKMFGEYILVNARNVRSVSFSHIVGSH